MTRKVADWQRATERYPSVKMGNEGWIDYFDRRPDVVYQILGDIFRVTKAEEAKAEGHGRDGRRTKAIAGSMDELYAMITPRYAIEPFPVAVKELQGDLSLRAFAALVPIDHRQLSRFIRGEVEPGSYWLEQIAVAGGVGPAFFLEWRIAFVVNAFTESFTAAPAASINAWKALTVGVRERR